MNSPKRFSFKSLSKQEDIIKKEWKEVQTLKKLYQTHHKKSVQYLQSYISNVTTRVPVWESVKEAYERIRVEIDGMDGVVWKLIELQRGIEGKKGKRMFGLGICGREIVGFMDIVIGMFRRDVEMKEVIWAALNEEENRYVLNNYLINWKKQTELDKGELLSIERQIFQHQNLLMKQGYVF